jgi:hypothetical protein
MMKNGILKVKQDVTCIRIRKYSLQTYFYLVEMCFRGVRKATREK